MDKIIWDAIENEHDFFQAMDNLVADLETLGAAVDIPYQFNEIAMFEGCDSIEEYERLYLNDRWYDPTDWCGLHD